MIYIVKKLKEIKEQEKSKKTKKPKKKKNIYLKALNLNVLQKLN